MIVPLVPEDAPALVDHLRREHAENGDGGFWFMQPQPVDALLGEYCTSLWHEYQVVWAYVDDGEIRGHVVVTRSPIATHRCTLGMHVEAAYRGQGIGRMLMEVACAWIDEQHDIEWTDGYALDGNDRVLALDYSVGFRTLAVVPDVVRIGERRIGQHILTRARNGELRS